MRPLFIALTTALLISAVADGQENSGSKVTSAPPPASIHFGSNVRISALGGLNGIEVPVRCGDDGAVFLRTDDVNSIIRIEQNGATTRYLAAINDLPNPTFIRYFPSEGALYALVRALTHTGRSYRLRPNASSRDVHQVEVAKLEYYIARFDSSGAYRGSQRLETTFTPVHIGVFSSGDFLVSGFDQESGEPRLALVNGRGQFVRPVELEGDITTKSAGVKDLGKKWFGGGSIRSSMQMMISTSDLVGDRGNLLLVRKQSDITIFEISPAGEVRRVKVKNILDGGTLESLKSADGRWLVQLTKDRPDGMGFTIYSYLVDPQDGRVQERLVYDQAVGFGLACYHGGEVTALEEQDGAVALLKGTIEPTKVSAPANLE